MEFQQPSIPLHFQYFQYFTVLVYSCIIKLPIASDVFSGSVTNSIYLMQRI